MLRSAIWQATQEPQSSQVNDLTYSRNEFRKNSSIQASLLIISETKIILYNF